MPKWCSWVRKTWTESVKSLLTRLLQMSLQTESFSKPNECWCTQNFPLSRFQWNLDTWMIPILSAYLKSGPQRHRCNSLRDTVKGITEPAVSNVAYFTFCKKSTINSVRYSGCSCWTQWPAPSMMWKLCIIRRSSAGLIRKIAQRWWALAFSMRLLLRCVNYIIYPQNLIIIEFRYFWPSFKILSRKGKI